MQTFVTFSSFYDTAKSLDNKRLGKQRVECKQILIALGLPVGLHVGNPESRWRNHPAVKMWRGYESGLVRYANVICQEWRLRGFVDNLGDEFAVLEEWLTKLPHHKTWLTYEKPPWVYSMDFLWSHRSNLLRKYPEHYRREWPVVPDNLPYIWPEGKKKGLADEYGSLRLHALWAESVV